MARLTPLRSAALTGAAALVGLALAGPGAAPTSAADPAAVSAGTTAGHAISASVAWDGRAMLPRLHPERIVDPAQLREGKAAAETYAAGQHVAAARLGPASAGGIGSRAASPRRAEATTPTPTRSWDGLREPNSQPSDSTSAVGTTRYVQTVNTDFAIYNRTSNTPISSGSLLDLTGCVTSSCSDNVFDPQVMWDGQTNRFYFAADDIVAEGVDNRLSFGYSKTASPNGPGDWCKYNISYGSDFPDYPKLGDSKDFAIIGVNVFTGNSFTGSDLVALSKPPAGTACADPTTFHFGVGADLKVAGSTTALAFTPVPATQVDPNGTGWAVARPASVPLAGATSLQLFKITKSASGDPLFQKTGTTVSVPAYKIPANAAQPGTADKLDTSDTRPTQAVSAIDPTRGGKVGLWTQHTVLGGAGAMVQYYEIDVVAHTLMLQGSLSGPSAYVYNGAVSPDRVLKGTTKAFGGSALIAVNVAGASFPAELQVISNVGGSLSPGGTTLLKASPTVDQGFGSGCSGECRWGDYAAATPDPAAPTSGTVGTVWVTSMYNGPSTFSGANWATWNAAVKL